MGLNSCPRAVCDNGMFGEERQWSQQANDFTACVAFLESFSFWAKFAENQNVSDNMSASCRIPEAQWHSFRAFFESVSYNCVSNSLTSRKSGHLSPYTKKRPSAGGSEFKSKACPQAGASAVVPLDRHILISNSEYPSARWTG